ncbi:tetratricopeptide repeat protein [Candidatus Laterigemmans baculatus]|uniref:tetratricopeptide repeat protein n=1 Tax=Candidatus Laterigemmans baculatus TaxID=2770505 RepID=UPI0013DB50C6|nr:tetratricopeptide repeat protein [Candidatus Laterigemmans baculatus]
MGTTTYFRTACFALSLAVLPVGVATERAQAADPPARGEAGLAAEIRQLIEQLGHPSYARRVRARGELERLGLIALDAIREAEDSADSEIALAARYLMSSLEVRWSKESDPLAVRQILDEYGAQPDAERKSRMDQLAGLPDRQGLRALARLARFERNLRLSRLAALLAMRPGTRLSPPGEVEAAVVRDVIGDSQRAASQWLAQYAADAAAGDYDARAWRALIDAERALAVGESDQQRRTTHTDAEILLELYRLSAERALGNEEREEALRLAIDSLDSVLPRREELMDAVDWALDTQLYEVVLELQQRETERFESEPELMYAAAEAYESMGQEQRVETYRQRALEIDALPLADAAADSQLPADEIEQRARRHREIGRVLETRGRFDWAEGEYRHVIERMPVDAIASAVVRAQLATMLGHLERHADVVEVLEPLVERLQRDQTFRARFQQQGLLDPEYVSSRLFYHRGLAAEGDAAREALRLALQQSPEDADVLIAMHRQPGDAAWKAEVQQAIDKVTRRFELIIEQLERVVRESRGGSQERFALAIACNQYAWLVSNTDGDAKKALECSLRSVELMPGEAAFLDTLARCYYANGQIDQAIASQERALRLEPHTVPLQRQMEWLRSERERMQTTGDDAAPPADLPEADTPPVEQ